MKILAIRGKNLASLEGQFSIDFREEPLRSAGLYAITGNTGSGKTTILDAMCIALYGISPRLENIRNSSVIEAGKSKSVSEDDPKTILRRGTYEGYAEVDFLAVDGSEYRARWSIARVRNSPTGNFRNTSYDIHNLRTGEHSSLKKKEYDSKIVELVGLTYKQFTRAVLLAQGEFAAFLKAEENEKARILQTLTGTGIYSRISSLIYTKCEEAKKELEIIEESKRNLVILTEEELLSLTGRKEQLENGLKENDTKSKVLVAKKDWHERDAQLAGMTESAEKLLSAANGRMLQLKPVAERLQTIDSVQEIRNAFVEHCKIEQERSRESITLSTMKLALENKMKELAELSSKAKEAMLLQEKCNNELHAMQPIINEAAKLEENIAASSKRKMEIGREIEKLVAERDKVKTRLIGYNSIALSLEKEENEISVWFSRMKEYEEVIPLIPAIVMNVAAIENHEISIVKKNELLNNVSKSLESYKELHTELRKREEELSRTLPSEIAALRERLVEGEPCPVCGSLQHKAMERILNTLEESELEKSRTEVKNSLSYVQLRIEECNKEISAISGAIDIHKSTTVELRQKNYGLLCNVANAEEILARKNLSATLNNLAKEWNAKREREIKIKEEIRINTNNVAAGNERLLAVEEELKVKQRNFDEIKCSIEAQSKKVSHLIGEGKSAADVQKQCNEAIAAAVASYTVAIEQKGDAANECNRLSGEVKAKEDYIAAREKRYELLSEEIKAYIGSKNGAIDEKMLAELFSLDSDVILSMRREIEQAGNAVATAQATLQERRRRIQEHRENPNKPADDEDIAFLREAIAASDEARRLIIEELSSVNATLLKNEENSLKFSQYKEKLEEKKKKAANWSALNSLFGSASGEKLMRLTQGYTLDILLSVANRHLREITGRYRLSRISDKGLGIKVIDLDMLSESRSVHTLSGGETFLVSLALSLALSSISSSRMSVGSLFIDEGFGALDAETLSMAMSALERIQSQGRKIGVISHLENILERIPVKIKVMKLSSGKSRVEISGK